MTDHECTALPEAQERIALGMKILIREGCAARDFDALMPLLARYDKELMFCTDDAYPDDLQQGHIDALVRRAIAAGMPFWNVLQAACATPVAHYGLPIGQLRVGDSADFIVVDNFRSLTILNTYIGGTKVYDRYEGVQPALHVRTRRTTAALPNNFKARPVGVADLQVEATGSKMRVIAAHERSLLTDVLTVAPRVEAGYVLTDTRKDVLKLVVQNRYEEAAPQVAFIHGFGLKRGALASTIAHDSHNIIAVGVSDTDLAAAINALVSSKGGMVAVCGDRQELLPLPVAGLMSDEEGTEVARVHARLRTMAQHMGCRFEAPFMTLAFMALPVIPRLKLTDRGLFDSEHFCFTPLFC